MRFTIDKEQLFKGLVTASHAVASKAPIPLLTNLKLDLNEKGLEITGSNSEITIRYTVPYMIEGREIIRNAGYGATLVNARIVTEAVRRVENQTLSVEVIDDSVVKIEDGKSSFKLNSMKAEEYPDIDLDPAGCVIEVKANMFASLVEQSAFAASQKDVRPILKSLNLQADGESLIATATDSARLARKTVLTYNDAKFTCNVPAKTVQEIVRLFENAESVRISVDDRKILFEFGRTVVSSRLIPGDYPVTSAIIPQNFNYYLEVNAQELLKAIDRVRILSADNEPVVKLSMKEDDVEISAKSDVNGSAVEHLSAYQFTGERIVVSFNSNFVIDAVKALKSEDVTICFLGEMKPFVVKNPKDATAVELITPMRTY
ncbi:MAG: DNA polymerase III subunit beta [Bacilli bacterium]|nr:DNA polymerase III subunit beta [Bacilli bacterium]